MNTTTSSRLNGWRLSILTALVGMALATLTVFVVTPSKVWAGQQFVKVLSSSQMVSPSTPDPAPPTRNVVDGQPQATLHAAKNEFESFQVYVKADANGIANLRVDPGTPLRPIDPETGNAIPGGTPIPAENLTIYREDFINITTRSDSEGNVGNWPDALIPEKDYIYGHDRNAFPHPVVAGGKAVAWVDVLIPKTAATGVYKGSVLVKNDPSPIPSNGGTVLKEIPVRIEVTGFEMPSTTSLESAFMMGQQTAGSVDDPCGGHPGFCDTHENRWKLYAMYGRSGLENRVTQPNAFGVGDSGNPPMAAQDAQFTKYGLPLINGLSSGVAIDHPSHSRLDGAKLTSVGATEWCGFQSNNNADYQSWCLDRWETLANQHGFADRFFLYTDDEIYTQEAWTEFKERATYAKSVWPGVQTLVTGPMNDGAVGTGDQKLGAQSNNAAPLVDKISPVINYMANKSCGNTYNLFVGNQRPAYNDFLGQASPAPQPKNDLWLYTSNMSFTSDTGEGCLYEGWPGYAIDQLDTQARTMGWMSYYYDADGELYWKTTKTLNRAWTNQYEQGGNGDGNLFYPGTPAKIGGPAGSDIPVESIRLKKIRDGREDFEYMKEIERRDRAAGVADPKKRVNDKILSIFGDRASAMHTTPSVEQLDNARLAMWNMLAADDPKIPCSSEVKGTPGTPVEGDATDNTMNGTAANENFCGYGGDDTISPAGGDDKVDGGTNTGAGDTISYAMATAGVHINLSAGHEDVFDPGAQDASIGYDAPVLNMENVLGSNHGDVIYGDGEVNVLTGGDGTSDGADEFYALEGNDTINSRDDVVDSVIDCGAGADRAVLDAAEADKAVGCETIEVPTDRVAPVVTPVSPKPGAAIRDRTPTIRATVRDDVTDLAKGDVQLYVGTRLISDANYSYDPGTDALVYESPRLPARKTTVRVVATDAAQNEGARAWSFTIRR